jgi:hypothetical protein
MGETRQATKKPSMDCTKFAVTSECGGDRVGSIPR